MKKILVVEDIGSIRRYLTDLLTLEGWNVTAAADGEQALRFFVGAGLTNEPFAIVLTDLCMPVMGGAELTRELHKFAPLTPVVILSGRKEEDVERALGNADAHAYIMAKPVRDTTAFLEILKTLALDEE